MNAVSSPLSLLETALLPRISIVASKVQDVQDSGLLHKELSFAWASSTASFGTGTLKETKLSPPHPSLPEPIAQGIGKLLRLGLLLFGSLM